MPDYKDVPNGPALMASATTNDHNDNSNSPLLNSSMVFTKPPLHPAATTSSSSSSSSSPAVVRAADLQYLGEHGVHRLFNAIATGLLQDRPPDVVAYISEWTSKLLGSHGMKAGYDLPAAPASAAKYPAPPMDRRSSVNFQRRTSRAAHPPERVSYPPMPGQQPHQSSRTHSQHAANSSSFSFPNQSFQESSIAPTDESELGGGLTGEKPSSQVDIFTRVAGDGSGDFSNRQPTEEASNDNVSGDESYDPVNLTGVTATTGATGETTGTEDWRPSPETLATQYASPVGKFEIIERISRGHYGTVYKATWLEKQQIVAVKKVAIDGHWVVNEYNNLVHCMGPYVVECFGCYYDKDEDMLWFVMECLSHTLEALIPRSAGMYPTENFLAGIIEQCLYALQFIHSKLRVHLDIKPANLLYNDLNNIKIGDLGTMGVIGEPCIQLGDFCFMAPEVAYSQGIFTGQSDVWSIGALILTLIDGAPPLCREDPNLLMYIHHETCMVPSLLEPNRWSTELNDFVRQCFIKNLAYRQSAEQMLKHPWILKHHKRRDSI